MRVLMLTWFFPPQEMSGIAAHVHGLASSLATAGHDVVVFAPPWRGGASDPAGVKVCRAVTGLPWLPDEDEAAHAASTCHHFVALIGELDGWQPDVVHVHDWRLAWAGGTIRELTGATLVTTFHGTERVRHGGHLPTGLPGTVHSVESWLALRSDAVIATSAFMVREVVAGLEVDADRVTQIPNGIDAAWWAQAQHPSVQHAQRAPLVFTWGRVQYEKGFQVLVRAMGLLRHSHDDLRCIIGGTGSYLAELQSRIDLDRVADRVELAGFLTDEELLDTLHRASCVVIPSLYEPFGIVALEALAGGAPLVVAETGGLAELVRSTEAGLMFEPGDAEQLASCIARILDEPELAQRLGDHASAMLTERYSWETIATSTVEWYEATRARIADR
ncbi:MAG: glycosyltransferase family 4 protein [Ilumatobacteraceae bacterium]